MAQVELTTVLLVLALVSVFVIAFKVLQAIFEVFTVAILSGVFYIALWHLFSFPLSAQRVLMFSALGAGLYVLYTLLSASYTVASLLLSPPLWLARKTVGAVSSLAPSVGSRKEGSEEVKEVVVEKVSDSE